MSDPMNKEPITDEGLDAVLVELQLRGWTRENVTYDLNARVIKVKVVRTTPRYSRHEVEFSRMSSTTWLARARADSDDVWNAWLEADSLHDYIEELNSEVEDEQGRG